jgi:acetyl-CoA synthetase
MLFVLLGKFNPRDMQKVHARENEVFGEPPEGLRVVARYSTVGERGGFVNIIDAESAEQLATLLLRFLGLVEFELHPIVDTAGGRVQRLIGEATGEIQPMHGPVAVPPAVEKVIESVLVETRKFDPPEELAKSAYIKSLEEYSKIFKQASDDMEGFWAEKAEQLDWTRRWDRVLDYDFQTAEVRWFDGGMLNVSHNCLDRHLESWRKNKAALIWEGEDGSTRIFSFQQLHHEVCRYANVLKTFGVEKGDRVTLYLPMIPELPIFMLACARIGAVHSVVFGGFSAESLRERILDADSGLLITADGGLRGGKIIGLKENADDALEDCPCVTRTIVVRRAGIPVEMMEGRDHWLDDLLDLPEITAVCEPEEMGSEDPLFILYTSGSTGKPKGVLHTTAGYLLYVMQTFKWIFDARDEDTHWCTADIGWVTGHSYIVYGPLACGVTSILYEGIPTYPAPDRFWEIVEKHRVNIFYTAPTVIRALARYGEEWVQKHDLDSLRILGSVGEPINPEAWMWYYKIVGDERCPIVDTWWQTETGGILIAPLPGAMPTKPGCASVPFPGVEARVVRNDGSPADVNEGGFLIVERPWPGIMRGVYGEPERFRETYFKRFPGTYFSGDGARVDEDGYFWLMGRVDDVINVSGHRIGTAEVESALVSHAAVAEVAVVGFPHAIKGQGIYAYVTTNEDVTPDKELRAGLLAHITREIGPIAKPDIIHFTDALPKTRSGKIMRRILRKIAAGEVSKDGLGDTSTLTDPSVVDGLIEGRKEHAAQ